jgi:hypothetical protein
VKKIGTAIAALVVLLAHGQVAVASRDKGYGVETISTRADYVTGADVLVKVRYKHDNRNHPLHITLNGRDVSAAFHAGDEPNTLVGLVTGLVDGKNLLRVRGNGSSGIKDETLELTNYPRSGAVLSGPPVQPYICMTDRFFLPDGTTLGPATDNDCSAPTQVKYVYKTTGGIFKALPSTQSLPEDVATTTTSDGAVVPYVVRFEAGTIDRGVFNIAILHDPTKEAAPSPFSRPKGWNRRLSYVHGYGCVGGWYYQGTATGVSVLDLYDISRYLSEGILVARPRPQNMALSFNVLSDTWLSRGYAVVTNTLNHPSISCNPHLAGEAAMMTKEYFVEHYGVPFYTISTGGSGGAYTSLQIADAFPGLFDGVSISATFPDALSIGIAGLHGHLLFHYWSEIAPGSLTDAQKVAISGYQSVGAALDAANQSGRTDPTTGRTVSWTSGYTSGQWTVIGGAYPDIEAVPASLRWDAVTNPSGARADVFDVGRNVYGIDPSTGYALRPFDNVGVQYGLSALNAGAISVSQFLDLNERIGGVDNNGNFIAARSVADTGALRRVYQTGVSLGGNGGLASIPIVDNGAANDASGYHYGWFHYAVRERLRAANGDSSNFVFWRGAVPAAATLELFEDWMNAYKSDDSDAPQIEKVLRAKPGNGVEGCWTTTGSFIAEPLVFSSDPVSQCSSLFPVYSNTVKEAGGPLAGDILKCQLKPIDPGDYQVQFTPAEVARLHAVFPEGVCNWSEPGVAQTGVIPYASLGPSPVNRIDQ